MGECKSKSNRPSGSAVPHGETPKIGLLHQVRQERQEKCDRKYYYYCRENSRFLGNRLINVRKACLANAGHHALRLIDECQTTRQQYATTISR